jgi:hypothetical protein
VLVSVLPPAIPTDVTIHEVDDESEPELNSLADAVTPGALDSHRIAAFFVVENGVVDEAGVLVRRDGRVWRGER